MLAALEAHQARFLAGAGIATNNAATSENEVAPIDKGKSVWDMGPSDLEGEEDGSSDEDSEDAKEIVTG